MNLIISAKTLSAIRSHSQVPLGARTSTYLFRGCNSTSSTDLWPNAGTESGFAEHRDGLGSPLEGKDHKRMNARLGTGPWKGMCTWGKGPVA